MTAATPDSFDLLEATVPDVHAAMEAGEVTAEALVERYLDRIDRYDDELNAVLTLNPDARERARDLDRRYEADGPVGPLHGVPTLVKDNHDTADMPTTAGCAALAESRPARDAVVVERLRDAGAVILGKTNLQELSFGVDTISSLGGETRNAYSRSHRPSGSSGGSAVAVAANLSTLATGSDTCSSVRSPPAFNACVGVRPTRGLVSRTGIVPLSLTQDTAGPITRTVGDAAQMLDAIAGYDPADPVTARGADAIPDGGYVSHVDPDGLSGARVGVARQFFGPRGGSDDEAEARTADAAAVTTVVDDAIAAVESAGATLVDPVEVVDLGKLESARVLTYEWARDFARYLEEIGDATPYDSLAEVVETGAIAEPIASRIEESGVLDVDPGTVDGDPDYLRRLRRREEVREATLATMAEHDLDALLYPPSRVPPVEIPAHQPFEELNCELSAHTGLPSIVMPAGTTDEGLPVGVELLGRAFAEPRLFELASGVERCVDARSPPADVGPLE